MAKMDLLKDYIVIPTSAESELALTNASEKEIIKYTPGSNDFTILKKDDISEKQKKALEYIKSHVLAKYGSTGIQKCIDEAVKLLDLIVVYPVEDDNHLTDKEGRILPDAYLVPRGSTAKDLAYKVHTDLGDHFIRAIDARTHRVIGSDHILNDGDVISIVADA
jgi:ribosome-binding ATPase YchF (GTP1/OBG family)